MVIWALTTAGAHAQEAAAPLILEEARGALPLAGQLDWLEDPQGGKSLDEVRRYQTWQRLPGQLKAGFTPSGVVRLAKLQIETAPRIPAGALSA